MATSRNMMHRCAQCGKEYPADTLVCPECKIIMIAPGQRRGPARWVIVLLIVVILALLVYAIILCRQIFVLHQL